MVKRKKFDKKYWFSIFLSILFFVVGFFGGKSYVNNGDFADLQNKYNLLNSSYNKLQVINSPNSISTMNQIGDNTIRTDIPQPKFELKSISYEKIEEGIYKEKFRLSIDSQVPIQTLRIAINDSNIISINANKDAMSSIMFKITTGTYEGLKYFQWDNAVGSYIIEVVTTSTPIDVSKIIIIYIDNSNKEYMAVSSPDSSS